MAPEGGSCTLERDAAPVFARPVVRLATERDCTELFALINEAYDVETGDRGVSFKHTKRLLSAHELLPLVAARADGGLFLAELTGHPSPAGCLAWEVVRHDVVTGAPLPLNHLHFGPFAVRPGLQRSGVGRALLNAMLAEAQRHNCACVDIEVVNHRTDILPWYEAQGYVRGAMLPPLASRRS